jgi:hypothetical protein
MGSAPQVIRSLTIVATEVLRAEAFLDVGEKVVLCLHEVRALSAGCRGFGITMQLEERSGGTRSFLTGAFEGIELIVVNSGGFVRERHDR